MGKRKSRAKITVLDNHIPRAESTNRFITLTTNNSNNLIRNKKIKEFMWERKFRDQTLAITKANGIPDNFTAWAYYLGLIDDAMDF